MLNEVWTTSAMLSRCIPASKNDFGSDVIAHL
jgi:hypothetical protein